MAETEWAAIRASQGAESDLVGAHNDQIPASSAEVDAYLKNTKSFRDQVAVNRGQSGRRHCASGQNVRSDLSLAVSVARHDRAFLRGGGCAAATKPRSGRARKGRSPRAARVADLLGVPAKNVHVLYREGSGCYGRLSTDDVPEDAAIMSRAVGKPVRVQWMREDEHAWEPKGPQQLISVRAGVDAQGKACCLGLYGPQLSVDHVGNPAAGFAATRHQSHRTGKLQRDRRRRRHLHVRSSESGRGADSLGAG